MRKIDRRRAVWVILTLLWMLLIFWFSAKPAVQSARESHEVGMWIGRIMMRLHGEQWTNAELEQFAVGADFLVRKGAHMSEYAVLGFLMSGAWGVWDRRNRHVIRRAVFGLLSVALYAVSDEAHQIFVPGRSGQVTDILLDSAGAAAGVLLAVGLLLLYRRKK